MVYVLINRQGGGSKRRSVDTRGLDLTNEHPVARIYGQSKAVARDSSRYEPLRIAFKKRHARNEQPLEQRSDYSLVASRDLTRRLSRRYAINTDFTNDDDTS